MGCAIQMKKTFISNLRLVAQFAREPISKDARTAIARSLALRETINSNLDKARALADGVLLEFGPSREQDLALRDRIRQLATEFAYDLHHPPRLVEVPCSATWFRVAESNPADAGGVRQPLGQGTGRNG